MGWSSILNDFKRNKGINLALLLFVALSSTLAVASVLMAVQTFTSISALYDTARPPHFLQMHKGEIDEEQINGFMADQEQVTYSQIVTMINVYGEDLTVIRDSDSYTLSDLRLDVGLVKQNPERDLLLNADHETITLDEGEIGMPVILTGMYDMAPGDRIILNADGIRREFVITDFVLDAQMNSTMASSTRILISDADYEALLGNIGETEAIIEAYFTDPGEASAFQTLYQNSGLPINGQAVTYSMIFLLSALTDIVTVFVLLLVSLLLVAVSFICVRFTVMAALEEEVREIGTMKAIGLPFSDIRDLYLRKYRLIALVGVAAGYLIAMAGSNVITGHISTTFGTSGLSPLAFVLSLLIAALVYVLIIHYCKRILGKIKQLSVVDALVSGKGFETNSGAIKDGMHKSRHLPVNWLLGLREVIFKFRNWAVVFAVMLLAVVMVMVPVNLLNTFEAPEFITYMGSSLEDILIEVDTAEDLEANYVQVQELLGSEPGIRDYSESRTVRLKTMDASGMPMNLDIEVGASAGNGLQYLEGKSPVGDDELALSLINAEEAGLGVGSMIELSIGDQTRTFEISGIYQDVTSGGKTAKSKYAFSDQPAYKYSFSINLLEGIDIEDQADAWAESLDSGVTVDPMADFIDQTLGGVSRQLRTIVMAIIIIGVLIALLITVLFLKLRLTKDMSEIGIMRAVGFSAADLNRQYLVKIGFAALLGIAGGILITNLAGEPLVNAALGMAGLGIKQVRLIVNPLMEYLIVPLLLIGLILLAARLVMGSIHKHDIVSIIES